MEVTIRERIAAEPAYRQLFYRLLDYCRTPRALVAIEREAAGTPQGRNAMHTCRRLLAWLEEDGAVARIGDGGALRWQTTAAGCNVARDYDPQARLAELLVGDDSLREIYLDLLHFCQLKKTRQEVERMLEGNPLTASLRVLPISFIQCLEQVGAVEWRDGSWATTECGIDGLARFRFKEEFARG